MDAARLEVSATNADTHQTRARIALIAGAILILALQRWVPMGRLILYPFTLLSTWVHEMGHGLTALLVGGRFLKLDIFADASGMAHLAVPRGLGSALSSAGGLLGPPLFGALCLIIARRAARPLLLVLAAGLLLSLVLWVRTLVGLFTVGGLGISIAILARFLPGNGRLFFAQLLGLLFVFDTLARGDYLFTEGARVGGALHPSDVASIATSLGGPYLLWGGLIACLSGVLIVVGLYSVLGRGRRP
ncbi:MAG: M50 family metallopeptidase [Myxococcales bacterium]|nr:M50 family metallopeptidase [Myxococcales bacterium]